MQVHVLYMYYSSLYYDFFYIGDCHFGNSYENNPLHSFSLLLVLLQSICFGENQRNTAMLDVN